MTFLIRVVTRASNGCELCYKIMWYLSKPNEMKLSVKSRKPKVDGTKSTLRWCQTSYFHGVAECCGLREIEANVNLMVQLKVRLEAP